MGDSEPAHSTGTAEPLAEFAAKTALPIVETGVLYRCAQWRDAGLDETRICRATEAAIWAATRDEGQEYELTVLLTSDAEARDLNLQWRGKDRPTNVLSFPLCSEAGQCGHIRLLGDVVLAYETVAGEARDSGLPLDDHATHLVVHGVLHLLGYDHQSDAEADIMENLERKVLAGLGLADPYAVSGRPQGEAV
jgi:probable rRNA maturation factor